MTRALSLDREDWVRIAEALSHFRHNPDYKRTLEKVTAVLGDTTGTPDPSAE